MKSMKNALTLALVAAGVTAVSLAAARPAQATIIVGDNFSATDGPTNLAGTTPDVADAPGGTWSVSTGPTAQTVGPHNTTYPSYYGIPAPLLFMWNNGGNGAATIALASNTGYTKPSQLQISAALYTNPEAFSNTAPVGAMIGFYGAAPVAGDPIVGFSGLVVDQRGDVTLVQDGVAGSTVAYTGAYTNTNYNTLSYDINTTTGGISDVSLAGNTYNFTATAFTDANTNYAAIGVTAPAGTNSYGGVRNFTVQTVAVPEPAALGLVAMAGALGMLLVSRKRKNA